MVIFFFRIIFVKYYSILIHCIGSGSSTKCQNGAMSDDTQLSGSSTFLAFLVWLLSEMLKDKLAFATAPVTSKTDTVSHSNKCSAVRRSIGKPLLIMFMKPQQVLQCFPCTSSFVILWFSLGTNQNQILHLTLSMLSKITFILSGFCDISICFLFTDRPKHCNIRTIKHLTWTRQILFLTIPLSYQNQELRAWTLGFWYR